MSASGGGKDLTSVSAVVGAFLNLPPKERAQVVAAIKQSTGVQVLPKASATRGKDANPAGSDRFPALLYERLRAKVYSYHGVRLPYLARLAAKTAAMQELEEVWHWLGGDQVAGDHKARAGLVELAAESLAREGNRWRSWNGSLSELVENLTAIPRAVDSGFPGYKAGGFLTHIARQLGAGTLALRDPNNLEDDDDA